MAQTLYCRKCDANVPVKYKGGFGCIGLAFNVLVCVPATLGLWLLFLPWWGSMGGYPYCQRCGKMTQTFHNWHAHEG